MTTKRTRLTSANDNVQTNRSGTTMTHNGTTDTTASTITAQALHREAMVQLKKSVAHHRQAALCLEAGNTQQAQTHGTLAFDRAAHAVEISGRAMFVKAPLRQAPGTRGTSSLVNRLVVVTRKIWRTTGL